MATVQGIYVALFGRPADPEGLAFWTAETNDGQDLTGLIGRLTAEPEAVARFAGLSNDEIINSIYQALFNRDADAEGLATFKAALEDGSQTLETIAINILDGAQGSDLTTVNNKITAADAFTAALDTSEEIAAYAGEDAAAVGRAFLDPVTEDEATIPNAEATQEAINPLLSPDAGLAPADDDTVTPNPVPAADFIVDGVNGVDDDGDTVFKTIQAAVDAADPGQIIEVVEGDYAESVTIDEAVTLRAQEGAKVTITPEDGEIGLTLSTVGKGFADENGDVLAIQGIDVAGSAGAGIVIANTSDSATLDDAIGKVSLTDVDVTGEYFISYMLVTGFNDLSNLTLTDVTLGGSESSVGGIGLLVEPTGGGVPTQSGGNENFIDIIAALGVGVGLLNPAVSAQVVAPESLDLSGVTINGGSVLSQLISDQLSSLIPDGFEEDLPVLDSLIVAPFGTQNVTGTASNDALIVVNTEDGKVGGTDGPASINGGGGRDLIVQFDLTDQITTITTEGAGGDFVFNVDFGIAVPENGGADVISTGDGSDVVVTASLPARHDERETINTGGGDDIIVHLSGVSHNENIDGGDGDQDTMIIGNAISGLGGLASAFFGDDLFDELAAAPMETSITGNGDGFSFESTSTIETQSFTGSGDVKNVENFQIFTGLGGDTVNIIGDFGGETAINIANASSLIGLDDSGDDTINFSGASNILEVTASGGAGEDTFDFVGVDNFEATISGGDGADTFVFGGTGSSLVVISDFEIGEDTLTFLNTTGTQEGEASLVGPVIPNQEVVDGNLNLSFDGLAGSITLSGITSTIDDITGFV